MMRPAMNIIIITSVRRAYRARHGALARV